MAAISNPDNFRTNVKVLLGEILEKEKYGDNLEKGIYNYTLETCTKMNIIKKWSNKYFVEIYKTKLRTIYNNLKTDSIKDLIIKKIIKPHKLAFMSHQEMLPEKWKELEEDIKIKRQNKYVPVVEASTDSYECRKCRDIENKQAKIEKRNVNRDQFTKCTHFQLQTRSADEPMTTFITCLNCGSKWKC